MHGHPPSGWHPEGMYPPVKQTSNFEYAVRLTGVLLAGVCVVPFVLGVWWALDETFDTSKKYVDGFGGLPGMLLALPFGLATSLLAPLAFPRRWWWLAYLVSVAAYIAFAVWFVPVVGSG